MPQESSGPDDARNESQPDDAIAGLRDYQIHSLLEETSDAVIQAFNVPGHGVHEYVCWSVAEAKGHRRAAQLRLAMASRLTDAEKSEAMRTVCELLVEHYRPQGAGG